MVEKVVPKGVSRRQFLEDTGRLAGAVIGGAALPMLFPGEASRDSDGSVGPIVSSDRLRSEFRRLGDPKHQVEALKDIKSYMKIRGYRELIRCPDGEILPYPIYYQKYLAKSGQRHWSPPTLEEFKDAVKMPCVVAQDSPLLEPLRGYVRTYPNRFMESKDWGHLVFLPKVAVKDDTAGTAEPGNKAIFIDTVREGSPSEGRPGTQRDPLEYLPTIAHEDFHLSKENVDGMRLRNEIAAAKREVEVCKHVFYHPKVDISARKKFLDWWTEAEIKIKFGEFLQQDRFGDDFARVYPKASGVTAPELWHAEIKDKTLQKYKDLRGPKEDDANLGSAVRIALLGRNRTMKEVIAALKDVVSKNEDELDVKNAKVALEFIEKRLQEP